MRKPIARPLQDRSRRHLRVLLALVLVLVVAAPAVAEVFHIELADGSVFDSRYKPEEASWDSSLLLLLTDYGTWIALPKDDVASIVTETESKGFGMVIDTTTIVLGFAANDAPNPEDAAELSAVDRLQQLIESQAPQDYTVQQFVEPGSAGRDTGGLPAYGAQAPPTYNLLGGPSASPAPD